MTSDPAAMAAFFVLGGTVGAFAGALIHAVAVRLPAEQTALGAPVCTGCRQPLPARRLVPFTRGTCPSCGAPAPWHKTATEAAAALITVLALAVQGLNYRGVTAALFGLVLLLILRIDWIYHLIYTITIAPSLVLAFGAAAIRSSGMLLSAVLAAAAAAIVFGGLFALAILIYKQQALGFGDILLAALIGAMTGVRYVAPAIFIGMLLAAVGGLFLIAIGKRTRRDYIPYGAYLCAGTILVLLFA